MKKWLLVVLAACGGERSSGDANGAGTQITIVTERAPAALVAYRDGANPWTVVTGAASPIVFSAPSGTYSIAIGCPSGRDKRVDYYELATSDLQTLEYDRECGEPVTMLSGSITSGNSSGLQVRWGEFEYSSFTPPDSYSLMVPNGTRDLVAARGQYMPDRLLVLREFAVASSITQNFDFGVADAIAVTGKPVTFPSQFGAVQSFHVTAGGTSTMLGLGTTLVFAVPESALGPGDFHVTSATDQNGVNSPLQVRSARVVARVPPSSIQLPMYIEAEATVTRQAAGLVAQWVVQPDATLYRLDAGNWYAHISPARFAGGTSNPDPGSIPGWDPALALDAAEWRLSAILQVPLDDALRAIPIREMEMRSVGWAGSL